MLGTSPAEAPDARSGKARSSADGSVPDAGTLPPLLRRAAPASVAPTFPARPRSEPPSSAPQASGCGAVPARGPHLQPDLWRVLGGLVLSLDWRHLQTEGPPHGAGHRVTSGAGPSPLG